MESEWCGSEVRQSGLGDRIFLVGLEGDFIHEHGSELSSSAKHSAHAERGLQPLLGKARSKFCRRFHGSEESEWIGCLLGSALTWAKLDQFLPTNGGEVRT